MNENFQHRVHALVVKADLAASPATNGLFDRGDLQDLIAGLAAAIGQLTELCQELERERDFLVEGLACASARQREAGEFMALAGASVSDAFLAPTGENQFPQSG